MATFRINSRPESPIPYQFKFINHSTGTLLYDLRQATGEDIVGALNPGQRFHSPVFESKGTLEQGNVPVVGVFAAIPAPGVRFWSGTDGQYINLLEGNGYRVTRNTSEISEVTGNGIRVTVDGGGVNNPTTANIYFQLYNA